MKGSCECNHLQVNKCIVDLSVAGKKDINDSIGKWGDVSFL